MASDPKLVERLKAALKQYTNVEPKPMFGGICFTLNNNMCIGVHNDNLIIRVGHSQAEKLMKRLYVKPMDLTGKVMKAWATVLPEAIRTDAELLEFAKLAVEFTETLPPK